eukprot:403365342
MKKFLAKRYYNSIVNENLGSNTILGIGTKSARAENLIKNKKQKTRARPKIKKQDKDGADIVDLGNNAQVKVLNFQLNKLQNMHVILTYGKMILDEYEREFNVLRDKIKIIKEILADRAQLLESQTTRTAQSIVQKILRVKRKVYEQDELKNKQDRLNRLNTNIELLQAMLLDQNRFEAKNLGISCIDKGLALAPGHKVYRRQDTNDILKSQNTQENITRSDFGDDIERQLPFKSKRDKIMKPHFEPQDSDFQEENLTSQDQREDDYREMYQHEIELMQQFDDNDHEIDMMLDQIIEQLSLIEMKAQNIETAIYNQAVLIKQVNQKATQARENLKKKSSALQEVLNKYKSQNKMCCIMILVIVLCCAVGLFVNIMKLGLKFGKYAI